MTQIASHNAAMPEVVLSLRDSEVTRKIWDHAFECLLTLRLGTPHGILSVNL